MKILVIQNGRSLPTQLIALFPTKTVVTYPLSFELDRVDPNQFDAVILSGSSQFPIPYSEDVIAPEIDLILRCKVPLLGICYGCELIAVAHGATLKDVGEASKIKGIYELLATETAIFTPPGVHKVYEAHRWVIDMLPPQTNSRGRFTIWSRNYSPRHVASDWIPVPSREICGRQ
jgi:GMP synthase-like glutamine amidotransferase